MSVVMPVYNQEKYVRQAIDSILAQTLTDFEFIVVDDGSTDRTAEILLTVRDSRFRYVLGPHVGFIRTLRRGYEEARGHWIARMDSDDISHPQRLERQLEFLAAHPECVFVGSAYGFMSPGGRLATRREQFEWKYVAPSEITLGGRVFGDPTTVFNRSTAADVGFYDPEFENENPLWYRLLSRGKGAVLGQTLYFNRWLLGSVSRSNFEANRRTHIAVRRRYDPINAVRLPEPSDQTNEKTMILGKGKLGIHIYLATGDRAAARELALKLWQRWPKAPATLRLLMWAFLGVDRFRVWRSHPKTVLAPLDPARWQGCETGKSVPLSGPRVALD